MSWKKAVEEIVKIKLMLSFLFVLILITLCNPHFIKEDKEFTNVIDVPNWRGFYPNFVEHIDGQKMLVTMKYSCEDSVYIYDNRNEQGIRRSLFVEFTGQGKCILTYTKKVYKLRWF